MRTTAIKTIFRVFAGVIVLFGAQLLPLEVSASNFGRNAFEYSVIPLSQRPRKDNKKTWPKVNCPSADVTECPSISTLGVKVKPPATSVGREMLAALQTLKSQVNAHDAPLLQKVEKLTNNDIPLKALEIRNLEQQIRTTNPINATYLKIVKKRPLVRQFNKLTLARREAKNQVINGQWIINEAYPSTDDHDAVCHDTGCASDLGVLGGGATKIKRNALWDFAKKKAVEEAQKGNYVFCYLRDEYRFPGSHSTKGHFHLESWLRANAQGTLTQCGL